MPTLKVWPPSAAADAAAEEAVDSAAEEATVEVDAAPPQADLQVYQTALAEGKITEKERLLWEYVLSAYGTEEFTTKQLEKDFRNAAYATIRTFVMKFHEMELLVARKTGNRVFYKVK